jgi:hypothetical protein
MKFSFESQQHRDDLAQELKETDKFERIALLEEKSNTLKYVLAQHIRDFERDADKSGERRRSEKEQEDDVSKNKSEKMTKQEIGIKDGDGNEHLIELEIADISDQIPESVKIIYDMNRLLEIEATIDDPDMVRGWEESDSDGNRKSFQNRDFYNKSVGEWHQNFRIVRKYVEMTNKERGVPLLKADGSPIDETELKRIAQQAAEEFKVFRSQVTEGLFDNPNVFYHTIGAYTNGWDGDNSRVARQSLPKETIDRSLANRFPHQTSEGDVVEEPIEIGENLQSHELWVHAGELIYDSMVKPLMMIDGSSERIRHRVRGVQSLTQGKFADFENSNNLRYALEFANTKNEWGALMHFENGATPWLLVADQIFDPYHGRLIKIKEIDKSEGE